jgi:hypothetical protein
MPHAPTSGRRAGAGLLHFRRQFASSDVNLDVGRWTATEHLTPVVKYFFSTYSGATQRRYYADYPSCDQFKDEHETINEKSSADGKTSRRRDTFLYEIRKNEFVGKKLNGKIKSHYTFARQSRANFNGSHVETASKALNIVKVRSPAEVAANTLLTFCRLTLTP